MRVGERCNDAEGQEVFFLPRKVLPPSTDEQEVKLKIQQWRSLHAMLVNQNLKLQGTEPSPVGFSQIRSLERF